MPRKFDFTRNVIATKMTALLFNKTTAEAENVSVTVPGKYTADDPKLAKIAEKMFVTPELKFIEVVDAEVEQTMYGWMLNDIMSMAVPLDPQSRQPIAD